MKFAPASEVQKEPLDWILGTEAVQSAALALEGINDVHGGDGLSFS